MTTSKTLSEMTNCELVDEVVKLQQRNADLVAHVEHLRRVLRNVSGTTTGPEGRHYSMDDELHRVRALAHTALHQLDDELRRQAEGGEE